MFVLLKKFMKNLCIFEKSCVEIDCFPANICPQFRKIFVMYNSIRDNDEKFHFVAI